MLPFMALMMLMMFAIYAWMLWIGTRTMFVLPLVADRGMQLFHSLPHELERHARAVLGIVAAVFPRRHDRHAWIVRLLRWARPLTTPLYFLTIAAAYDGRLGIQSGRTPGSIVTG